MGLKEEKELTKAIAEFTAAVKIFQKKDYEKAGSAFEGIIKHYEDSEYYSVLEIHGRAKVYKNICQSQLNPVQVELDRDENYLSEGIFNLNAGNFDRAFELLEPLAKKGYQEAYANYLLSLIHFKKKDIDTAMAYLGKAVAKDSCYKIIAHNEPDFDDMFENEAFLAIIEDQDEKKFK
jgi:tetratricopeptide (TPR) repeat protein